VQSNFAVPSLAFGLVDVRHRPMELADDLVATQPELRDDLHVPQVVVEHPPQIKFEQSRPVGQKQKVAKPPMAVAAVYVYLAWLLWREERREQPETGWRLRRSGRESLGPCIRIEPRARARADQRED
jgi:hypothetical protein